MTIKFEATHQTPPWLILSLKHYFNIENQSQIDAVSWSEGPRNPALVRTIGMLTYLGARPDTHLERRTPTIQSLVPHLDRRVTARSPTAVCHRIARQLRHPSRILVHKGRLSLGKGRSAVSVHDLCVNFDLERLWLLNKAAVLVGEVLSSVHKGSVRGNFATVRDDSGCRGQTGFRGR